MNNEKMMKPTEDTMTTSSKNREASETLVPQILTRSSVLPGVDELDAGDVIECYALMRPAPLENAFPSGTSSSNQRIEVGKSAIAFRYKPKSASPDATMKRQFELTLEYGPQRTGSDQSLESMPHINGGDAADDDNKYLSWTNNANIYYSLSIASEDWNNAYYMAPVTGAVLTKILDDYIIDYSMQNPRYQPFTVIEKSTSATVLKSSNSDDFVWNVFSKLAEMYVAIEPVLAPTRYALSFFVEDMERDMEFLSIQNVIEVEDDDDLSDFEKEMYHGGNRSTKKLNVGDAAADFYLKFTSCVEAIRTMDYSFYDKTLAPSSQPSTAPTPIPSSSPTSKASERPSERPSEQDLKEPSDQSDGEEEVVKDGYYLSRRDLKKSSHSTNHEKDDRIDTVDETDDTHIEDKVRYPDQEETSEEIVEELVEDANTAAEEAVKAAEAAFEAAESVEDTKAAEAATEAAIAAKKAAQATSSAAAQSAMEGLYSGDGKLMTAFTSSCFSDTKYGIRHDHDYQDSIEGIDFNYTASTSNVFLYIDGIQYYRLNVTAPYWTVSMIEKPLPTTTPVPPGEGDLFDFALAISIIGGFFFGMIVMFHNIGLLNWDKRLRLSWFFHPHGTNDHLDNIKPKTRLPNVNFFRRIQYSSAAIDDHTDRNEIFPDRINGKEALFKSEPHMGTTIELPEYDGESLDFGENSNDSKMRRMRANLENETRASRGEVDFPNLSSSSRIAVPRG